MSQTGIVPCEVINHNPSQELTSLFFHPSPSKILQNLLTHHNYQKAVNRVLNVVFSITDDTKKWVRTKDFKRNLAQNLETHLSCVYYSTHLKGEI